MLNIDNRLIEEISPKIGPNALSVLLAISIHLDQETFTCFPSHSRLMDLTGMGKNAVYDALNKLKEVGLLESLQLIDSEKGRFSKRSFKVNTEYISIFIKAKNVQTLPEIREPFPENREPENREPEIGKPNRLASKQINNTVGSNAPTEFDELWNKYNFKKGSKKKALDLYLKLPEKDRQSLRLALPAYLADSVTQQVPGAPFKPMRRHLQFFISGRVWESYLDQIQESKAEDQQTPYDEQYAAYLDYCRKKYPAVLDAIRHLSKKQFVEYKEQNYHSSLHRLGQKMQVNEFLRSHTHFQDGHPDTLKHPNVWEYHKVRLNQLIQSAFNV